ncbi:type I polyketide synthase [Nocardiopsis chromatogenes]|uniref:type I polyketide synthase n=1 Tax=Nocardiopsis chromatogenes TaxID=280239 RepID=UPI00034D104B|nr:type I polyketide synthase [Nocardiopsis chromatogenes]
MVNSSDRAEPVEPAVLTRAEGASFRLFAFPHAGGHHTAFRDWPAGLPHDVELVSYTLPGRGRLRDRSPLRDWPSLVEALTGLVRRYDDGAPFAFFGHSFGALAAFEVCRRLGEEGARLPSLLMLSAHRPPHLPPAWDHPEVPDDRLVDRVRQWGLVPDGLLDDDGLLSLVLPPLRADLALDGDYPCRTGARSGRRISVPCVVYGGGQDRTTRPDELRAWGEHFAEEAPFEVEILPGGHFYTVDSREALLASVTRNLGRLRAAARPSVTVAAPRPDAPEGTLWERFTACAEARPDAVALVDHPGRWTYRELSDRATALARDLAARGTAKGDPVGILLPGSAHYCAALLGCFALGAPACLLERNWPPSLLHRFLESAEVATVVTTPGLAERLPESFRTSALVIGDDRAPSGGPSRGPLALPRIEPSDTAMISMTSGTSGTPKAVLNTHEGCLYCFDARYERYPYGEESRDGLNVFFAWECLRPLLQGKSAAVVPDDSILDPVRLVRTLEETRTTRIVITPSLLESVLDHPAVGADLAARLGHMETVFLMGEVVPARVVDKAEALFPPGLGLVNAYSTWECLDISYADLLPRGATAAAARSPAPVGRILDGSCAALLDEQGTPVPQGSVGELYFSGPGVAVGYLADPQKTAERFVPCPGALTGTPFADATFYRTGDRARVLPQGDIEVLGRVGDVVKIRGFKVSLHSVERVLEEQPGVARAVVRPVPDAGTGPPTHVAAYVVGDRGKPSESVLARLRQAAERHLPTHARPRHYIGMEALPVSGDGSRKLDLKALPAPQEHPGGGSRDGAPRAGLTTGERRLAEAWQAVLGVGEVGPDDDFFELGGDSLQAARLSGVLAERFGISLPVVDVFQAGTLRAMAESCTGGGRGDPDGARRPRRSPAGDAPRLAVVGMSGRFPGAPTIGAFWENLKEGTDSLTVFSREELRRMGVAEETLSHPDWVPAAQMVDGADAFDAGFWGIGRREAVLMDPQHRLFVETAWSALEQAGYARRDNPYRRRTGMFAACGIDGYLIHHLQGGGLKSPLDPGGLFLTEIGNEKDYIATRASYLLDLGGPAVTVTSACSSALVAVAEAAQSIVMGQCDMAVAGASAINFPNFGYRYEDGLVGSEDGRVRPFDEAASGTLFGDSVGAVVLKRLDAALEDGDHVWAVLTGFGVSNDGRRKAGYTAPSARAQAQCISDAIAMAGIGSESISYVECHATATHIGDAIEISGLRSAFDEHSGGHAGSVPAGGCAIGSVKGNIGHANCAAGITGFIKTVLCLYHRTLVPTVHFQTLNPKLVGLVDSADSPFSVQETCREWDVAAPGVQLPRRAGVSSFGIGGTNAHVVLEEAPEAPRAGPEDLSGDRTRSLHLVTVSARSADALRRNSEALVERLQELPDEEVGPAVRALHLTREAHPLRTGAVVGADGSGLDGLRGAGAPAGREGGNRSGGASVAFCFSGQGSQASGMARGLYRGRADGGRFARHFDAACAALAPHAPEDPARLVLDADEVSVMRPLATQCGLFAVEYAIARSLLDIGVRPAAVAGHSIGEYAAAAVSGLLTLEEAALLVAVRARATETLLPAGGEGAGGMLSVVGDQERLADWVDGREGLWTAAWNAPGRTVLSGERSVLRDAGKQLEPLGFTCRPVPVSHAFHSGLMAPVADRLTEAASGMHARQPEIPTASNLTGTWFDARYRPADHWGAHMLAPVRWDDCVGALLKWEPDVLLEVGPGGVLTSLARKRLKGAGASGPAPLACMPGAGDPERDDEEDFLRALGALWCRGVDLDFAAFHEGEETAPRRPRPLLPTYSFDRTGYWTRPEASAYIEAGHGRPEHGAAAGAPSTPEAQGAAGAGPRRLIRFEARPESAVRLYCFPYAGGGSAAFRDWARTAPDWLDVVAVEPAGRADRPASEPPCDDVRYLREVAEEVRADAGTDPVVFCGLSSGAAAAVDLLGGPLADWAHGGRLAALCAVGRSPVTPGAAAPECPPDSYLMVPEEVRDDAEWRRSALPVLMADLEADRRAEDRIAERMRRGPTALLDCPIQVHCGTEDPSFPAASAGEWARVSGNPLTEVRLHEGGHDFMLVHRRRILDQVAALLERLLPDAAADAGAAERVLHEVRWTPPGAGSDSPRTGGRGAPESGAPARVPQDAGGGRANGSARPQSATAAAPRPAPVDLAHVGAAEAARLLADALNGEDAVAALWCRTVEDADPERLCADFLLLLRSLAVSEARGRLILVLPACGAGGLVAGLTRSVELEEPGLTVQRLYLDARSGDDVGPDGIAGLLDRALALPGEPDLLHRGGALLAGRLLPSRLPALPVGTLGTVHGSYLVTGGTGGIGRAVTDWLIGAQGVPPERVVVTGRSEPGDLRPGVRFLPADLSGRGPDPDTIAARTGPLAGVLHLAGALDDGVLRNLDVARLPRVLAPKLALRRLTRVARAAGAPWIVAFSSTSALLGSPGQANYAAANGWMDAYAAWEGGPGGPDVLAVDWGTWGGTGMAARTGEARNAARGAGETPLSAATALSMLGRIVGAALAGGADGRNHAVCDVDWAHSPWAGAPLLSAVSPPSPAPRRTDRAEAGTALPSPSPASGGGTPGGGPPGDGTADDGLRAVLGDYVHQWDESEPLADLGLDSLDFVRMRADLARRLGKEVPLEVIADPGQTLGGLYSALADY